jgi:hypothetical protein
MEGVELAIRRGLIAAKRRIAQFIKELRPSSNVGNLEEAELKVNFNWSDAQVGLIPAARVTAASRYQTWYYDTFRGTKRAHPDDELRRADPLADPLVCPPTHLSFPSYRRARSATEDT